LVQLICGRKVGKDEGTREEEKDGGDARGKRRGMMSLLCEQTVI